MKKDLNKLKMCTNSIKSFLVLLLVFIYSLNTYSAVVSDNDGSAFITKAEYDSLKNSFQSQLDSYNTQLDYKIDSAIAGYLAGIKAGRSVMLENYVEKLYSQNKWANSFADKSSPIAGSNNNKFTKGGWWLFWVYGWNTVASTVNGQCNLASNHYAAHDLALNPSSVESLKWFVKGYELNGNKYYGPYDNKLYNINQFVYIQRIISTWNNGSTTHSASSRIWIDQTFDLTALSVPGTTNAGSYNAGWVNFDNIQGTIILNYSLYGDNKRQWAAMSSSGSCDTSSTYNYCIDYDKQNDLTESGSENTRFASTYGSQWQEFNPRVPSNGVSEGKANVPKFTLNFKTPKCLSLRNVDLYNWVASEYIGKRVPMYAGIPMTKVPKKGKIKFNFHIEDLALADDTPKTTDNATIAVKASEFLNTEINSESTLLFYAENCKQNVNYTAEFNIDVDKDTILYLKATPNNSASYVRLFIDGNPTYTME